jgi:hypothetical protein
MLTKELVIFVLISGKLKIIDVCITFNCFIKLVIVTIKGLW